MIVMVNVIVPCTLSAGVLLPSVLVNSSGLVMPNNMDTAGQTAGSHMLTLDIKFSHIYIILLCMLLFLANLRQFIVFKTKD